MADIGTQWNGMEQKPRATADATPVERPAQATDSASRRVRRETSDETTFTPGNAPSNAQNDGPCSQSVWVRRCQVSRYVATGTPTTLSASYAATASTEDRRPPRPTASNSAPKRFTPSPARIP